VIEPFQLPFVQRGLLEILILAVPAGLLGTWIVVRGLAFFSHAVGTAAFPGLVLADGLGFAPPLGALAAALAFTVANAAIGRGRDRGRDSVIALVLVGCLAAGVILASDVFSSGANVETLLFGSLLLIDGGDIRLAALAAAATLLASGLLGQHWLAHGFDPDTGGSGRTERQLADAALLGLIALASVATLAIVGALLLGALFVVPAATARLLTARIWSWQLASIALVAVEGTAGLWLSVKTDAPLGATIACVTGAVFAAVTLAKEAARSLLGARVAAAAAAALALLVSGCSASASSDGKLEVVATTTQIGDWVRQVGAGAVSVDQVLQPNTDPHEYEPRSSDVEAAATAKLVFVNGDNLDGWISQVLSDSGSAATIVDLGASVPVHQPGETNGPEASAYDPHWWHDPRNAEAAVGEIERRLAAADPSHRRLFQRNAHAYLAKLSRLDAGIARCMASISAASRKLVTDHDAFDYFAERYGIEVVGAVFPSQVTQAQPSAKDLSALIESIEREGVGALFPESSMSPSVAEAVARQTGASVEETLYGDTLGPSGSPGGTCLGMEAANAEAMVRGFTAGRRGCPLGP
jgi:ABC-type Zn uptake system ZnuABC Zn-binding protein ZnuA/ABC-type Mn2+/Zn2+ transport system permease subunit